MKKILFYYILLQSSLASAVGFVSGNPGYTVNSIDMADRKPGLSLETELRDQLLTVPVFTFYKDGDDWSFDSMCTGTLVGNKYVLTARHCFANTLLDSTSVETGWRDIDISRSREYFVYILTYTTNALNPLTITQHGNVYKFIHDGLYKENTSFAAIAQGDRSSIIPNANFELIQVKSINILSKQRDISLLTLDKVPEIVSARKIDPIREVKFEDYKGYFNREVERIERAGRRYPEGSYDNLEFMGFGYPLNIDPLSDTDKNKLYLNLRSKTSPVMPYFLPSDVLEDLKLSTWAAKNLMDLRRDFFILTFPGQNSDSGDSGTAISYTEENEKRIIGILTGHPITRFNTNHNNWGLSQHSVFVSGFTNEIIQRLEELRRRP